MSRTFRDVPRTAFFRHPRHHQRLVIEGKRGASLPDAIRDGSWADIQPTSYRQAESGPLEDWWLDGEGRRLMAAKRLRLIRRRQARLTPR